MNQEFRRRRNKLREEIKEARLELEEVTEDIKLCKRYRKKQTRKKKYYHLRVDLWNHIENLRKRKWDLETEIYNKIIAIKNMCL